MAAPTIVGRVARGEWRVASELWSVSPERSQLTVMEKRQNEANPPVKIRPTRLYSHRSRRKSLIQGQKSFRRVGKAHHP